MTIVRVSVATVARIPHAVAYGIHAVAPRLRSRYTVHAVAVSIMGAGFRMGNSEHEALHWLAEHCPRVLCAVLEFGWEPLSELLKGIGMAPYLDGAVNSTLKKIGPAEEKK